MVRLMDRFVVPFFTKENGSLNEPLLPGGEIEKEFQLQDSATPRDYLVSPTSTRSLLTSTRVIKGRDGKTYVNNVADVEAEVNDKDMDMFVISDDDVENDLSSNDVNLNTTRQSIATNMKLRKSPSGRIVFA